MENKELGNTIDFLLDTNNWLGIITIFSNITGEIIQTIVIVFLHRKLLVIFVNVFATVMLKR